VGAVVATHAVERYRNHHGLSIASGSVPHTGNSGYGPGQ